MRTKEIEYLIGWWIGLPLIIWMVYQIIKNNRESK